jgi:hypothetical protein
MTGLTALQACIPGEQHRCDKFKLSISSRVERSPRVEKLIKLADPTYAQATLAIAEVAGE